MRIVYYPIDKAIEFLDDHIAINRMYSYYYYYYFPEQLDIHKKEADLTELEKKSKECLKYAINKKGKYNMRYYYRCLQNLFPDYGIKKLYVFLLLDDKDMLIGACNWSVGSNGMDSTLSDLFISHKHRGRGLAQVLTNFVIQQAKKYSETNGGINKILLTVDTDNEPAIKAYEKCGFSNIMSFDKDKNKMELSLNSFLG
jgi:GNAT superfamily N-acetyltransferase